jgi:site-specific recombinase XerD
MKTCTGAPTWHAALDFFFREYLPAHRAVSPHTQASYATALRLLLAHLRGRASGPHELTVAQVLSFLEGLERERGNASASRNLRLAALRSFWKAMTLWDPGHRDRYEHLASVPCKRAQARSPDFLEREEVRRLFQQAEARSSRGFRDQTILRYLYNTGSRVSEVANAHVAWLSLGDQPQVRILGKRGKWRVCPLWETTAAMLRVYLATERQAPRTGWEERLFLTRRGRGFTRGGLWKLLHGYFGRLVAAMPSVAHKRLSPHSLRHTTAIHLLQAGVEIHVIKAWLGHADVSTTSRYLDLDLDRKRDALERFRKLDVERMASGGAGAAAPLPEALVRWLETL